MNIDEWAAEQCGGVWTNIGESYPYDLYLWVFPDGKKYTKDAWTIKDPRCRDRFRNWWLKEYPRAAVIFYADEVCYKKAYDEGLGIRGKNEEACITAIYEALKNRSYQGDK